MALLFFMLCIGYPAAGFYKFASALSFTALVILIPNRGFEGIAGYWRYFFVHNMSHFDVQPGYFRHCRVLRALFRTWLPKCWCPTKHAARPTSTPSALSSGASSRWHLCKWSMLCKHSFESVWSASNHFYESRLFFGRAFLEQLDPCLVQMWTVAS